MFRHFLVFITWYIYVFLVAADYSGFDDSVLFKLNWPGPDESLLAARADQESIEVTTHNKEKYKCLIPKIEKEENEKEAVYTGPAPLDLVSMLFSSTTCSYRMENYWTYEVCHGNYIKQYHEDRDGKVITMQEYFLGKWDKQKTADLREKLSTAEQNDEKLKTIRFDGVNLPYLELDMTDGTFCELSGDHRVTKMLYVCSPGVKSEISSIKETSTCNYEVIISTPTLCAHPSFNPKNTDDNAINCVPLGDSPNKPKSLLMSEVDNMKKILDMSKEFTRQRVTVVKLGQKEGTIKAEIITNDFMPALNKAAAAAISEQSESAAAAAAKTPLITSKLDNTSPIIEFLEGKNCLTGGTGWWKYEFCYGRYVRQFHVDKNGETSVNLGSFDEDAHIEWLKENPQKRPNSKPGSRTHLTHFYQGGALCDKTGEKRQTEVQLKCMENSSSLTKVSLFLMEPKVCQYILGVESPLICEIIEKANEDGLVPRHLISQIVDQKNAAQRRNENEIVKEETSDVSYENTNN